MALQDLLQNANAGVSSAEAANALSRNVQLAAVATAFADLRTALEAAIGASTAYTPTLASGTGTLTSAAATGHYITLGNYTWVSISIVITTNGTAATSITATLPASQVAATAGVIAGAGTVVNTNMLKGVIAAAGSVVTVTNYDNTYPGGDGRTLVVSGWYEHT